VSDYSFILNINHSFQLHLEQTELPIVLPLIHNRHQTVSRLTQNDLRTNSTAIVDTEPSGHFGERAQSVIHFGDDESAIFAGTTDEDWILSIHLSLYCDELD